MLGLIHLRDPKIVCTIALCYVGHLPSRPPSLVNQAKGKLLMMLLALHRISQEITGGALIGQSFLPEHASKQAHEIDITAAPWTGHRRPKDCVRKEPLQRHQRE